MKKIHNIILLILLLATSYNAFPQGDLPIEGDCTYTLSPSGPINVPRDQGSITVYIYTETNCIWSANSISSWITFSNNTGSSNGSFTIFYAKNTTTSSRTATISVASKTITLVQAAGCGEMEEQETITISSPINDLDCRIENGILKARDAVNLNGTFSYSASSNDPLTIKTDPNIICDVTYQNEIDPEDRNINTSLEVGNIPGSYNVTPTGALTYNMPIDIPQGTAGIQPNLSVAYNSQSGNGLLGYGWNLTGLSSITRVGSDHFHEGYIKGINFDDDDHFAIDGNRLVAVNGEYGADLTEYRTEQETFMHIVSYGQAGNGPQKFKVWTKQGTILEYGCTTDSRIEATGKSEALAWLLNKVEDENGNYYQIYYNETSSGESYPDKIVYTKNDAQGLSGFASINFYYEERSDPSRAYIVGSKTELNVLLHKIKIDISGKTYRTYEFNYNESFYSHLTKVTLSGENGEKLNYTSFNWGEEAAQKFSMDDYSVFGSVANGGSKFFTGDFNGDGETDILRLLYTAEGIQNYHFFQYEMYQKESSGLSLKDQGTLDDSFLGVYVGDYDGDGKDDFIIVKENGEYHNFKFISYGNTPDLETQVLQSGSEFKYFQGDFDGDGRTQLIGLRGEHTVLNIYLEKNTGGTYKLDYEFQTSGEDKFDFSKKVIQVDFDGDGKLDILNATESGCKIFKLESYAGSHRLTAKLIYDTGFPTSYHSIYTGDFNGDHKTDILTYSTGAKWELHYSTGTGFTKGVCPLTKTINPEDNYSDYHYYVSDLNGDGKSDILEIYKTSSSPVKQKLNVFYSKGLSFVNEHKEYPLENIKYFYHFGDFNGDGNQDIFYRSASQPTKIISFHKNERRHQLKAVTNGFNLTTNFEYKSISEEGFHNYSENAVFPVMDFAGTLYAVYAIRFKDAQGNSGNILYDYVNAKVHKQGKGFLGFSTIHIDNDYTGQFITDEYTYDPDYFYLQHKERTISGTEIKNIKNTHDKIVYSNGRYFPYIKERSVYDQNSNVKVKENFDYDNDGNPIEIKTSYINNSNNVTHGEKIITSTYKARSNSTIKSLPELVETTSTVDGDTKTIYTRYDYFASNNMLKLKIDFFSNPKSISTDYLYDNVGNIKEIKLSTPGEEADRITKYEYSSAFDYRFLTKETNSLGYVTLYNYSQNGNLLSIEDPNGFITEHKYNNFNKLAYTKTPTGHIINNSLSWSIGTGPEHCAYSSLTTETESPYTKKYFDKLGRILRKETVAFNGNPVYVDYEYNNKGMLYRESLPYFSGTKTWKTKTFDMYNRVKTYITPYASITYNYENSNALTIKNNHNNTEIRKEFNAMGLLKKVTDPLDNDLIYEYYGNGKIHNVITPDGTLTMEYDIQGNRTKLLDLNAGQTDYTYNGFGEIKTQTDANGNQFTMQYDGGGRVISQDGPEYDLSYTYDEILKGYLYDVTATNGTSTHHTYDEIGNLVQTKETIEGQDFIHSYTYDDYNRLLTEEYPSGFSVTNHYNTHGYMYKISNSGSTIWELKNTDAFGNITEHEYGGYKETKTTDKGRLYKIDLPQVFTEEINYYDDGNISFRKVLDQTEDYTYDNLNRLETSQVNPRDIKTFEYYDNGNIKTFPGVGTLNYGNNAGPHAITSVINNRGIPLTEQTITYNSFNKIKAIGEGADSLEFLYGVGKERKKMSYFQNKTLVKTKFYSGLYEKIEEAGGYKELNYISSPDGIIGVMVKDNTGNENLYYIAKDYQGSFRVLFKNSGSIVDRYAFDPWGNRRQAKDWSLEETNTENFILDRGYTGHEHLDKFGLINMNGRVYDSKLGRFLSPDNFVQMPEDLQNYNKYAYCLNNPLLYSDPSGELASAIVWPIVCFATMYVGDAVGNIANGIDNPFSTAWDNATSTWNGVNNALQVAVFENKNTNVSVGVSPFTLGLGATFAHREGNMEYSASGGIGVGGWYVGGGASYSAGDLNIGVGIGAGNNHLSWGANARFDGFGVGYYQTYYGNNISGISGTSNPQSVGGANIFLNDVSIRLENDFLMFKGQDRWRSNGVEVSYKSFSLGTYLYNNDPKNTYGSDDFSLDRTSPFWGLNRAGKDGTPYGGWNKGYTYMSPLYFGYRYGNSVYRTGYNHHSFQDLTQNMVHKYFPPGRQHYYQDYSKFNYGMYYYQGWYNPFSLWGR